MRASLRLMAVLMCLWLIASLAIAQSSAPPGGAQPRSAPAASASAASSVRVSVASAAPTTPAVAPSSVASSLPAGDGLDAGTFQVRMRQLEQRIDELKLRIRRSHTRLSLLSETILSSGTGGAKAEVVFSNQMSQAFRLTQALFVLDGAVQYKQAERFRRSRR
jgi:hypothetical protein